MGAQLSKGGVAVEGKAVADTAGAKTNGQVRFGCWFISTLSFNAHFQRGSCGQRVQGSEYRRVDSA